MRLWPFIAFMVFGLVVTAQGQPTPARTGRQAQLPTAKKTKPKILQPHYLTAPLSLTETNVGRDFSGHDITAIVAAIEKAKLKDKTEFESTPAFQERRAQFLTHPLYASVMPLDYLGFVVDGESLPSQFAPAFKYDADSQALGITVTGRESLFILEKDQPTLDSVLVRRILRTQDNYVGGNAFGAKVEVEHTYSEEYGIAFQQNNWLFKSSKALMYRQFKHSFALSPEEAITLKPDAKLVLVCRLSEPLSRHSAHGHDPTISEPFETITGENYLQAEPEELWVFNQKTGEVLLKITKSSTVRQ